LHAPTLWDSCLHFSHSQIDHHFPVLFYFIKTFFYFCGSSSLWVYCLLTSLQQTHTHGHSHVHLQAALTQPPQERRAGT
jgi:hypothetical protein